MSSAKLMAEPGGPFKWLEIIPGSKPGLVSLRTPLLKLPFDKTMLRAVGIEDAVTENIPRAQAMVTGKKLDVWINIQENGGRRARGA